MRLLDVCLIVSTGYNGQFTPTMQLSSTQLNCRGCGWQWNDIISTVTSQCCAQTIVCWPGWTVQLSHVGIVGVNWP